MPRENWWMRFPPASIAGSAAPPGRCISNRRASRPPAPPAATAAFGATVGPRVLPGDYTVRMTRGDKVYTTQLTVALDPRAQFTVADRKAQFDLVNQIGV